MVEGKWEEQEVLVETDDLERWGDNVKLTKVGQPQTRVKRIDVSAAVAAVDLQTAEEALSLIKVEYEELPFCRCIPSD